MCFHRRPIKYIAREIYPWLSSLMFVGFSFSAPNISRRLLRHAISCAIEHKEVYSASIWNFSFCLTIVKVLLRSVKAFPRQSVSIFIIRKIIIRVCLYFTLGAWLESCFGCIVSSGTFVILFWRMILEFRASFDFSISIKSNSENIRQWLWGFETW